MIFFGNLSSFSCQTMLLKVMLLRGRMKRGEMVMGRQRQAEKKVEKGRRVVMRMQRKKKRVRS